MNEPKSGESFDENDPKYRVSASHIVWETLINLLYAWTTKSFLRARKNITLLIFLMIFWSNVGPNLNLIKIENGAF